MELTPQERSSPLWRKMLEDFKAKRDRLRERNDGDIDPTKTAGLRGQIAVYKELIALDNDPIDLQ